MAYANNYADFDQAYDPINGLTYQNTSSQYTVAAGDTLQSIAYQIWGDASFWYMIADANGLMGDETLSAGQVLTIPNKVHNSHNTSDVFRVYDPNEAIGNNSPTAPKPQKHHSGGCGGIGQILLVVIAVAVAAITAGAAVAALTPGLSLVGGMTAFAAGTTGLSAGTLIGIGAVAGAAGSIVSQGVGLALGIQSKFDWGGVAMAAISGGVSAGLGTIQGLSGIGGAAVRGALGSAITQGIGVATGLQKRFDWAGVAAAGVTGAVGATIGGDTASQRIAGEFVGGLFGAATRSLISGGDFGDNLLASLPDIIGSTIGNAVAAGMNGDITTEGRSDGTHFTDAEAACGEVIPHLDFGGGPEDAAAVEHFMDTLTPTSPKQAFADLGKAAWNSLIDLANLNSSVAFNPYLRAENDAQRFTFDREGFGKSVEFLTVIAETNVLSEFAGVAGLGERAAIAGRAAASSAVETGAAGVAARSTVPALRLGEDVGPALRGPIQNKGATGSITVNGYTYSIEIRRVTRIEGKLMSNLAQGRNASAQLQAGGADRLETDEGGHFVARRFDGPTDALNHFAQDENFNRGAYKALENTWQRALDAGSSVTIDISPSYTGNSMRPVSITVIYRINDAPIVKVFSNRPGG